MKLAFTNSDLKQKVDDIMNRLFAGGVNNPITAIEQITFLMFLKDITEMDERQSRMSELNSKKYQSIFINGSSKYSWRVIARLQGKELFDTLTEAIEKLHELPNLTKVGKMLFRQAHLKIYNQPTLKAIVELIDSIDYSNSEKYDSDIKGDLYEYLLGKLSVAKRAGQFRTPRHIIKKMVEILDLKPSDTIFDPACGTAGFLVEAYKHIIEENTSEEEKKAGHLSGDKLKPAQHKFLQNQAINGYDNDADMIKIAIMNLYLHNINATNVKFFDPLCSPEEEKKKYDKVLANPPFSGTINQESIQEDINLNTTKTELLFLKYMYDHLVDGGRSAVIVPEGVLFGSTGGHKKMRQILMDECFIDAVVSLPSGVFKPYAGVKTAIIFYTKGGKTEKVWFYEVVGDGYTLDDNRNPDPKNDNLKDLVTAFKKKEKGEFSWFASRKKIEEEDLNLTAGRYKPITIEEVKYEDPKKIIGDVLKIEKEIVDGLNKLSKEI